MGRTTLGFCFGGRPFWSSTFRFRLAQSIWRSPHKIRWSGRLGCLRCHGRTHQYRPPVRRQEPFHFVITLFDLSEDDSLPHQIAKLAESMAVTILTNVVCWVVAKTPKPIYQIQHFQVKIIWQRNANLGSSLSSSIKRDVNRTMLHLYVYDCAFRLITDDLIIRIKLCQPLLF